MTDVSVFMVYAAFVALTCGMIALCDWLRRGES
jgi:hypothetical protein